MQSFEHGVFIFIVVWACLKMTGVISYIQSVLQLKEARRSAEKWACYVIMHGNEQELRALVRDYRNLIKENTVTRALNRLSHLVEEREQHEAEIEKDRITQIQLRRPIN